MKLKFGHELCQNVTVKKVYYRCIGTKKRVVYSLVDGMVHALMIHYI